MTEERERERERERVRERERECAIETFKVGQKVDTSEAPALDMQMLRQDVPCSTGNLWEVGGGSLASIRGLQRNGLGRGGFPHIVPKRSLVTIPWGPLQNHVLRKT